MTPLTIMLASASFSPFRLGSFFILVRAARPRTRPTSERGTDNAIAMIANVLVFASTEGSILGVGLPAGVTGAAPGVKGVGAVDGGVGVNADFSADESDVSGALDGLFGAVVIEGGGRVTGAAGEEMGLAAGGVAFGTGVIGVSFLGRGPGVPEVIPGRIAGFAVSAVGNFEGATAGFWAGLTIGAVGFLTGAAPGVESFSASFLSSSSAAMFYYYL